VKFGTENFHAGFVSRIVQNPIPEWLMLNLCRVAAVKINDVMVAAIHCAPFRSRCHFISPNPVTLLL